MHPYHAWPFLSAPSQPVLSALWAVLVHGFLGVIVVLPIIWNRSRRIPLGALAFIGAVALDLDHVAAAWSLDPSSLEHLGQRPDTHSLLFVCVLALIALVVTRRKLIAWAAFAVLASHLLFDAAGGSENWLFPLQHPDAIPWFACPLGIILLTGISALVARAAGFYPGRPAPRSPPDTNPTAEHPRAGRAPSLVVVEGHEEDLGGEVSVEAG